MSFIELQRLFGKRVRYFRDKKGLSQETLAELADITPRYMIDIEQGKYGPSFKKLDSLAKALGVQVKDLFDFTDL